MSMKSKISFGILSILLLSLVRVEAQDIPMVNFDGLAPFISKKNDTTYVVNFWATWCRPCVEELPYFLEAEEKFKGQKVKFIMVSMDFPKMLESRLKPFLQKNKLPGQVILLNDPDGNTWIPKVNKDWDGAIPVTYIYNKEKSIFISTNFENAEQLIKNINSIN
ncbi:MAG: TlpA family protein disulfide reductase [Saprospiraceae bacterium]|nr:TlpA family protein disulfide reductase [Candidatus Brachybacter algidus]MBL0119944.1 TlpA family protein disulfide reductase [Candidatus Brachybacter algidus]